MRFGYTLRPVYARRWFVRLVGPELLFSSVGSGWRFLRRLLFFIDAEFLFGKVDVDLLDEVIEGPGCSPVTEEHTDQWDKKGASGDRECLSVCLFIGGKLFPQASCFQAAKRRSVVLSAAPYEVLTSASQETVAGHHCQMPSVTMRVNPAGMQPMRLTVTLRLMSVVESPHLRKYWSALISCRSK